MGAKRWQNRNQSVSPGTRKKSEVQRRSKYQTFFRKRIWVGPIPQDLYNPEKLLVMKNLHSIRSLTFYDHLCGLSQEGITRHRKCPVWRVCVGRFGANRKRSPQCSKVLMGKSGTKGISVSLSIIPQQSWWKAGSLMYYIYNDCCLVFS